jgi:hypothetical protein
MIAEAQAAGPFVLHPENQKFLAGQTRTIVSWEGDSRVGLTVAVILLACGLGLLPFCLKEWAAWQTLHHDGTATEAVVLGLRRVRDADAGTVYYVRYQIDAESGDGSRRFVREGDASAEGFRSLREGGPVAVLYRQSDPAFSRLVNERTREFPTFMVLILLGVTGLGLFVLNRTLRLRRLAWQGKVMTGRVLNCTCKHDSDGLIVKVAYAFEAPGLGFLRGTGTAQREDLSPETAPLPGTAVRVLYLNERLHRVL